MRFVKRSYIRGFAIRSAAIGCVAGGLLIGAGIATHAENSGRAPSKAPASDASPQASSAVDPRVKALLDRITSASRAAHSMTADFSYTVESTRRDQFVSGTVALMKPNYARVRFSTMTEPAFPNLVASDGKNIYSFTPRSFDEDKRVFRPDPLYTSDNGARAASGDDADGGKVTSMPVAADGSNLFLWDGMAVQAFFSPEEGLKWLYYSQLSELKYEGERTIDGVRYRILRHEFAHGSVEGGEKSAFVQRVFVGPDDLIHRYDLEFQTGGQHGHQSMQLHNVRLNAEMNPTDFSYTPPVMETSRPVPPRYRVTASAADSK